MVRFKALFSKLLDPKHDILCIKYFTALVSGKIDPDQPIRQKSFLRALKSHIPEIEIIYGHFMTHTVIMPLSHSLSKFKDKTFYVPVLKTEEKGSDVNIAVHLLNDAWDNRFDCAVVVSNDSDLSEALRFVSQHNKKTIGLINPRLKQHPARELMKYATFYREIRAGVLKASQLPDTIPGTKIHKPSKW